MFLTTSESVKQLILGWEGGCVNAPIVSLSLLAQELSNYQSCQDPQTWS